ncbi:MAG: 5-formyltetrahydrofolate cyclo-ligase [Nitrososphaerota archaeon]|nr:5-formyltetrahydrofolate cyclo-ligase [Candidatus Bathyarchaeota archaeon]MDW8048185.1 5-formyltetrahydrofolate cyclo-ligase [Nitrososphaerota archaeon]
MSDIKEEKESIRRRIWSLMEEKGVTSFPRPVYGRIPNFKGAEKAARRLMDLKEYMDARVVKVNPDAPQHPVRAMVLSDRKTLIMPTPRLRRGFMLLNPDRVAASCLEASTIGGAFKYGEICPLEKMPRIDLVIVGSVAVTPNGKRVGKGGGYCELEYAILREVGAVDKDTPVFTTVHDIQVVENLPCEDHDLIVDAILTPTKVIIVESEREKPRGIIWEKISHHHLKEIPILSELKEKQTN